MPELPTASLIFSYIWQFIQAWWWLFLPWFLAGQIPRSRKSGAKPFWYFWKFWRVENWFKNNYKPILLEVKVPRDVVKPIRAMEQVLDGIHQALWEPPNWIEEWWEGQVPLGLDFEIVSIGGQIHFYIRIHEKYRDIVEANIYSQYPEAEINLAEDYTKYVPQDIPNKEWDFWATDYKFLKPNPYPIATYKNFETETEPLEEKRVDPMASLLENLSKVKPGEQFWIQISASPMAEEYVESFLEEGKKLRDKLARRPEEEKPKPIIDWVTQLFLEIPKTVVRGIQMAIIGKAVDEDIKAEEKREEIIPPEMKLTPGEREIIAAVENKISKPVFSCNIRFIYMGKRGIWFKPNLRLGFGYFANFTTNNMNNMVCYGKTLTKVKSRPILNILLCDKRRLYLRQRKLFRQYKERYQPAFPLSGRHPFVFVLNSEELASLFHFPSWQVAPVPGFPRVEAKKGPPPELPVE